MAKRPSAPQFPPEVCGVCSFCTFEKQDALCWVAPPTFLFVAEDGQPVFHRGVPIDPNCPWCKDGKPRLHG